MNSLRSICVFALLSFTFSSGALADKRAVPPESPHLSKDLSVLSAKFAGKLSPKLLEAVAAKPDRVSVIVLLNDPDVASALGADFGETDLLETYMEAADRDIEAVIHSLPAADITVGHRYRTINGFSATVTVTALEELSKNESVKIINPDLIHKAYRVEGKNLMKVPAVHARANRGAKITVAVIDDGVDYSHAELGATPIGSFPNSVVIGGHDFVAGTFEPSPSPQNDENSHGTAVAGIIAGRGDSRGGSGVAPEAKIVGLRAMADLTGTTANIIAAVDWVTQNRTNVNPPIKVLNMSLGAGRFDSACNGAPDIAAYEQAISRVSNAGVIVVAAAGNEGWTGMGVPACLSQVISVGAVYDANIGSSGPYAVRENDHCLDPTTAADQPTCYSNIASNMTLRGPSHNAYSPKAGGGYMEDMGGTSAAAPYVAGTIALMLEKFPSMSRSQIVNALRASGKAISEIGIVVPRVDIDATMRALGDTGGEVPTGPCVASNTTLCLLGNRFAVTITATDQNGKNGVGRAVSIVGNDKFGFFSIPDLTSDASNPEMLVKMLDARVIGSGFWVFYGPMTTFEVRLTVRDTQKNVSKTYTKTAGNVIGGSDTSGFTP